MTPSTVRWGALSCALIAGGCTLNSGVAPTPATMNFPIALALSRAEPGVAPTHLFVANSNFDLRFNQATLMAFDLDVVHRRIDDSCTGEDPCTIEDLVAPSPSGIPGVLADEVAFGSHAEGIAVSPSGSRIYLPVRSDRNLTFVDWSGTEFGCGSDEETGTGIPICGESHRSGNEEGIASERELTLNGDPVAVSVGSIEDIGGEPGSGDFVLMALREGRVALFIDQAGDASVPELVHIAEDFSENIVTMTLQPGTGVAWLTSAIAPQLDRVAIQLDPVNRNRSFLYNFGGLRLLGLDDGADIRDLQFHPDNPEEQAFALSRRPEAVVTLDLSGQSDLDLGEIYEVGAGPSRMAIAELFGRRYVFASCFDSRKLFVIDLDHGALVATLGGFSGPFEIVVEPVRGYLYMADFSTSVVRIVNLNPLEDGLAPELVGTLGDPTPVESFVNR